MKPPIPDDDSFLDATDISASTPEERAAAEALRDALDWRSIEGDEASLLASLKAAHSPTPIDDAAHRAIVDAALAPAAKLRLERRATTSPKRGVVIRVAFGASALVAAAAAVLFAVRPPTASDVEPFVARSTQALFTGEPFVMGGTTARVDRIASVRAAEFRENQFARWGVR